VGIENLTEGKSRIEACRNLNHFQVELEITVVFFEFLSSFFQFGTATNYKGLELHLKFIAKSKRCPLYYLFLLLILNQRKFVISWK
jgi:hypothetical protein